MSPQKPSSVAPSPQILTAQFRQMDQELAEAVRQREEDRQQWAEQASKAEADLTALRARLEVQEGELKSLREAGEEALQREKMEVARLEADLTLSKEAELAAVQAHKDALERHEAERAQLEGELASVRESAAVSVDAMEKEKSDVEQLEKELVVLREEREAFQSKSGIIDEIWRHIRSVGLDSEAEETPPPADPSALLDAVRSLTRLKDEKNEVIRTMETIKGLILAQKHIFVLTLMRRV